MSLCRLKCVCTRWRRVIAHPDHRHLLPRFHLHDGIVGFFHYEHFINVSGGGLPLVDPLRLLLPECDALELVDSCNGLLLCRCWRLTDPRRFDCLVVNPVTEEWVVLPDSAWSDKKQIACLGFDPAVSSSHFHVFELVEENPADVYGNVDGDGHDGTIKAVEIYSSQTGVWSHKDNGWGYGISVLDDWRSVFFNGMLHLITMVDVVAVVDVEGNTWRTIPMPQSVA